ncbi:MAG: Gfo/Idh/MocA family oxidoreductase [Deinococcota bacterium]
MANSPDKLRIGIVGTGNIAGPYVNDLKGSQQVDLAGVTDAFIDKARAFASEHDLKFYDDLDAMLADDSIDIIVNLTIHHAHYEITKRCLEAGKHVYSEKPLALTYAQAQELIGLAADKGLRLGVSPFTFLGEAQQTAWQQLRAGVLGTVRVVYAEVNWARIETWHPNPAPFYDVGPLWDVGVYPLTLLTVLFGPVRKVTSYGTTLHADRKTLEDEAFTLSGPDFLVCMLEHASGVLTRLTANFYVSHSSKQESGLELHGDAQSLFLSSWFHPNASVELAPFNEPYEKLPLHAPAPDDIRWGTGIRDMIDSLLHNTPQHTSGEQAAHIVEVLEAAYTSVETGQAVSVGSSFPVPEPLI